MRCVGLVIMDSSLSKIVSNIANYDDQSSHRSIVSQKRDLSSTQSNNTVLSSEQITAHAAELTRIPSTKSSDGLFFFFPLRHSLSPTRWSRITPLWDRFSLGIGTPGRSDPDTRNYYRKRFPREFTCTNVQQYNISTSDCPYSKHNWD